MPGEVVLNEIFSARVIEWRGPAPFVFVAIPEALVGEVRYAARRASYGWGCVPVSAQIGAEAFTTSLFPRDGGYLLPLKLAVRRAARIGLGDEIKAAMQIVAPA